MAMYSHTKVLIVDDEEILRKALAFQFERAGYRVFCAENGKIAYRIAKEESVDAIVSDIRMPGGDGIDLLKNIRSDNPALPVVIFISAYAALSSEQVYELGANAIFSKPFDRIELLKTVHQAIEAKGRLWDLYGDSKNLAEGKASADSTLIRVTENSRVAFGRGGFFLPLDSRGVFRPGQSVSFEVEAKAVLADEPVRGIGIVRWTRPQPGVDSRLIPGIGIEVRGLSEKSTKALREYLARFPVVPFIPQS